MESMIKVGPDAAKIATALPAMTKAIMAILNSGAGDDVKKSALEALRTAYRIENVTISGCTFTGK